ncbi:MULTISPECIES: hypothetical protein, partial [unclassified Lactococcus]|uniref:hypothetical protein n=1 Tax=unclassified Lactococcus TaxID=2643510 RepID=UPI001C9D4641
SPSAFLLYNIPLDNKTALMDGLRERKNFHELVWLAPTSFYHNLVILQAFSVNWIFKTALLGGV